MQRVRKAKQSEQRGNQRQTPLLPSPGASLWAAPSPRSGTAYHCSLSRKKAANYPHMQGGGFDTIWCIRTADTTGLADTELTLVVLDIPEVCPPHRHSGARGPSLKVTWQPLLVREGGSCPACL